MGKARFNFVDKTAPDYNPYGTTYTARQLRILLEEIPLDGVQMNELSVLVRKTLKIGDTALHDIALQLYDQKKNPMEYFPKYTLEAAKEILQMLTPWEIEWKDKKGPQE